jgi:hypothetical protein
VTWTLSEKPLLPTSKVSATRALGSILRALGEANLLKAHKGLTEEFRGDPESLTLPPFYLLNSDPVHPSGWFAVVPSVPAYRIAEAYDKLSAISLGSEESPGRILSDLFPPNSVSSKLVRRLKAPSCWLRAASTLACIALRVGGEVDTSPRGEPGAFRVRLGPYLLEASSGGMWVNSRRAYMPSAERVETDKSWPYGPYLETQTSVPELLALYELSGRCPTGAINAANVVARAVLEGHMTEAEVTEIADRHRAKLLALGRRGAHTLDRAGTALEQALGILDSASHDVARNLYPAVVPALMSSRRFRSHFGTPGKIPEGRVTSNATRIRWVEMLTKEWEALRDANI